MTPALTVHDIAVAEQVADETVRIWIKAGELKAYRTNGTGGPYRVRPEAYEQFRESRERLRDDPWVRTRPRRRRTA